MPDLFKDIIPSILETKEYVLLTEADEKSYPKFLVNKALSYHSDTVLVANELNKYPTVDNKLHYDFCLNIIKPYKRPRSKWHKRVDTADLDVVKEYYGYSTAKAMAAMSLLNDDQITQMKKELSKGG
jgi:hypothetical protein